MDLSYEMRRDHLRVVVSGPFDPRRAGIELTNIIRASDTSGLTRILIDARGITQPVSVADRFDLAVQLAHQSQGRVRLAIVVNESNLFTKTLEDTATNRGVAVRTTASMEEATSFLGIAVPQAGRAA